MRAGSRRVDGRGLVRLGKRWLVLPVLLSAAMPASAQSLDIPGTYGNADGCKFAKGGTAENDQFLVLRPDSLQSYGSACDFVQVLTAKDGTKVVTGLCESEGEDGVGVYMFAIRKSQKDPAALAVYDNEGGLWGEVEPCP
jgi:hypothetical protein